MTTYYKICFQVCKIVSSRVVLKVVLKPFNTKKASVQYGSICTLTPQVEYDHIL